MKTTTPYKPWEIMSYAKDLLGIGYIQRAFAEALDELRQTKAKYLSEYYRKHGKDKERRVD